MEKQKRKHSGLKCGRCKEVIFSWYTHDFKYCFCGAIFVDGGFSYMRCGYEPGVSYTSVKWDETLDCPWPAQRFRRDSFPY